jgi:outer membrane protein OmpA-like peptidoglycan-associated protein
MTTGEQPYNIELPLQAKFIIKASAKGYVDKVDSVDTKPDKVNVELNFNLQPIEVGMVVNLKKVLFRQGTAELLNDSYTELDEVFHFLSDNPPVRIELAGHTDNQGSAKANLKLSQSRVDAVKKYLTGKGVQPNRITGKGYGGTKPIASNATEETRKLNRRVEFMITGK